MIVEETIEKMTKLKLPHMAAAFRELLDKAAGSALSVEECVGLMIDREWTARENSRISRRIKDAKLGMQACMEEVWCEPSRGVDRAVVRSLSTCHWVSAKQNIILIGLTGTGKSYLGAAFAEAACRRGYRALRVRAPRLLDELAIARANGSYAATLSRLAKLDVLVLDDLFIAPLTSMEQRDLLEVLDDRYDRCSTVVTSQVPTKTWHEMQNDPTLADAICDRLVHNAHVLSLKGGSIRKRKGLEGKSKEERTEGNEG
ncbi:IS21-like element helper ATPase IstB [Polyangium fumosum]|nr:IS21-like element helper ATPase IstB [Polyangium fumosum]